MDTKNKKIVAVDILNITFVVLTILAILYRIEEYSFAENNLSDSGSHYINGTLNLTSWIFFTSALLVFSIAPIIEYYAFKANTLEVKPLQKYGNITISISVIGTALLPNDSFEFLHIFFAYAILGCALSTQISLWNEIRKSKNNYSSYFQKMYVFLAIIAFTAIFSREYLQEVSIYVGIIITSLDIRMICTPEKFQRKTNPFAVDSKNAKAKRSKSLKVKSKSPKGKKNSSSIIGKVVQYALLVIPILYLFIATHEFGHVITIKSLGYEVRAFEIKLNLFAESSHVKWSPGSANIENWHEVLIYASGSAFTLVVGMTLLALVYKKQLNKYAETAIFIYSTYLIMDIFLYNVIDVFIGQTGDWYWIYGEFPLLNFIVCVFGACLLSYMVLNRRKLIKEINLFPAKKENVSTIYCLKKDIPSGKITRIPANVIIYPNNYIEIPTTGKLIPVPNMDKYLLGDFLCMIFDEKADRFIPRFPPSSEADGRLNPEINTILSSYKEDLVQKIADIKQTNSAIDSIKISHGLESLWDFVDSNPFEFVRRYSPRPKVFSAKFSAKITAIAKRHDKFFYNTFKVINKETGKSTHEKAIVDTGSNVLLCSPKVAKNIGADQKEMRGAVLQGVGSETGKAFSVNLQYKGILIPDVECVIMSSLKDKLGVDLLVSANVVNFLKYEHGVDIIYG